MSECSGEAAACVWRQTPTPTDNQWPTDAQATDAQVVIMNGGGRTYDEGNYARACVRARDARRIGIHRQCAQTFGSA